MKTTFWQPRGIAILICAGCVAQVWAQDVTDGSQSSSPEPSSVSSSRVSRAPANSTLGQRTDQAGASDANSTDGSTGQRVERSPAIRGAYVGDSTATDEAESATQSRPNAERGAAPPVPLSSPLGYFAAEKTEQRNVISGGVSFQTVYNDNALLGLVGNSNQIAEFSYSIRPYLDLGQQ
jgi:hypothetical protein